MELKTECPDGEHVERKAKQNLESNINIEELSRTIVPKGRNRCHIVWLDYFCYFGNSLTDYEQTFDHWIEPSQL